MRSSNTKAQVWSSLLESSKIKVEHGRGVWGCVCMCVACIGMCYGLTHVPCKIYMLKS